MRPRSMQGESSRRDHRRTAFFAVAAILVTACSPPSASDLVKDVIAQRNQYEARLSSWVIRDDGTAQPFLYLDVLVVNNSQQSLRKLTVLVGQLDADNKSLGSTRLTMEVSSLTLGISQNIGVEVRPVYEHVEGVRLIIEPNPDPSSWDEFPEFAAVRPRI